MPASIDMEIKHGSRLGLLGRDYRGLRFELLRETGDGVRAGEPLMRDLRRPEILVAAPGPGRVGRVERGARRKLLSLQIEVDEKLGTVELAPPAGTDRDAQRAFLLASGCWSSLRTRPFGNIPDPDAEPAAILVTAMDIEPADSLAPTLIDAFAEEFSAAVDLLARISAAPLYVCHAPGYRPRIDAASGARCHAFSGNPFAGLPGRHIQALCPIGFAGGEVWHVGYQQTIAIGHLLLHGKPWLQRALSLRGDAVRRPRNLLIPAGAAVDELLADEIESGPTRVLDGSPVFGCVIQPDQDFIASTQDQLTVMRDSAAASESRAMGTLIPGDWLESRAPPGIYAVPLLRALQLGDAQRARQLGALELVEEDLAPIRRACVSNADYGRLLRRVLDELEQAR